MTADTKQPGDEQSQPRGNERKQQAFREQLTDHAAPGRAERQANADFALARDVAGSRLFLRPIDVYVPTHSAQARASLLVRIHGDPEVARRALLERLTTIDPNIGGITTLRTMPQAGMIRLARRT